MQAGPDSVRERVIFLVKEVGELPELSPKIDEDASDLHLEHPSMCKYLFIERGQHIRKTPMKVVCCFEDRCKQIEASVPDAKSFAVAKACGSVAGRGIAQRDAIGKGAGYDGGFGPEDVFPVIHEGLAEGHIPGIRGQIVKQIF